MFKLLNVVCWFISFALLSVSGHDSEKQRILQLDSQSILKRFAVGSDHDILQLLDLAQEHNLDVWQTTGSHVDIYFPKNTPVPVIDASVVVEWHVDTTLPTPSNNRSWDLSFFSNSSYHTTYHPLAEVEEFMAELSSLFPELVQIIPLGRSAEQREMLGMKISTTRSKDHDNPHRLAQKMSIVIIGAQHAREWITVSTALYLAHSLVANSSDIFSISALLDTYDFHILPVVNPDGYRYTWESDRFWYKNRQILGPNEKCVGIDMNRNWGYKWKPTVEFKAGSDLCHHWYPGSRPFQSPEANNVANYVTTLPKVAMLLDLRSYGQMISCPFSHSCKRSPKDFEDQLEAAIGAVHTISNVHGFSYTAGRLCSTLYKAPGNIIDWMHKRIGVKFTYAVHLRDTGTYGFALPQDWIRPVGEETAKMVEYLAKFLVTDGH